MEMEIDSIVTVLCLYGSNTWLSYIFFKKFQYDFNGLEKNCNT